MSDHTKGRLQAVIYRHAGRPDTICLKDDQGNELVHWMGFDTGTYPKATIRANAKRLAAGWNSLDEAAETILALRKEVEAAKADAALARQGYETAYAEFDDKCRTVNKLVVERNTLRRLLVKYGDRVRMGTSSDDQHVIDDAFAALATEQTP